MDMNMANLLSRRVAQQADYPAVIGPGPNDVLTYGELEERIQAAADQLVRLGVRKQQAVGLHYRSGLEYIVLTYALWQIGACSVPIAVELSPDEKCEICRAIHLHGVISEPRGVSVFESIRTGAVYEIHADAFLFQVTTETTEPERLWDLNPAFIRFTSGSTGRSKGVVLSHATIQDRIHAANDYLRIGPKDRIIWLLSMSHHFVVSITSYLSFGAAIVLCPNHLGATIVERCTRHKGTIIYGSPIHYELMAGDASGCMLPNLRMPISTTIALGRDTAAAFQRRFNKGLVQAYGIIEVGLPCINDDPLNRPEAVGRAFTRV